MSEQILPLDAWHRRLGARMVEFAGYQMPIQYEGIIADHKWTREAAGLFDVSHMGQLIVAGAEAETGGQAWFFMCYLSESPPPNAGTATSVRSSATAVQLLLANVSCNVYAAAGGAPSAENVERLRDAFDDLARRIHP